MKVNRTTDEIVLLIEQHKKEIWEYKQKESDWIKTKNLADGYKKVIEDISSKLINQSEIIKQLEQEIERLVAENKK
jgi:K+/H+ antiporter YhaU regulatory subunit KhtT